MSESTILYQLEISASLSFKKKNLVIATDHISHGKHHFPISEIDGIITGIKSNTLIAGRGELSREYSIEIHSKSGKSIDLAFTGGLPNKAVMEKQYEDMMAALQQAYVGPKVNHYIQTILDGGRFQIDDFGFSKAGLHLKKSRLFRKALEFDVSWADITWKIDSTQFLNIGSASNPKAKSSLSMETENQAFELLAFLQAAKQDPRLG